MADEGIQVKVFKTGDFVLCKWECHECDADDEGKESEENSEKWLPARLGKCSDNGKWDVFWLTRKDRVLVSELIDGEPSMSHGVVQSDLRPIDERKTTVLKAKGICHPKPPRATTSPSCGPLAKQSPQKIIADIHAIAPPTECLLDDHLLASSNNPAILEQLHAVSHMPDDFTPAYGAPMPAFLSRQQVPGPSSVDAYRCKKIREIVSQEESSALLRRELDYLSTSDRQILLQQAGIVSAIGAGEALAIKAGLGMPWSKLRVLRSSGGEELRGAPLVFMPDLKQKVIQMITATDSVTNLHSALDRFRDQVKQLQGMKWREYTIKVFMCGDYEFLTKLYGVSGATGMLPARDIHNRIVTGKYPCLGERRALSQSPSGSTDSNTLVALSRTRNIAAYPEMSGHLAICESPNIPV
ncbi:hypothetical protein EMCRGX_G026430 [Ephydatia muelleri]